MTTRESHTILLYPSGIFFNPMEPDVEKIHVPDIAHALASLPRFGGHTSAPYSVARHCVLVSLYVGVSLLVLGGLVPS